MSDDADLEELKAQTQKGSRVSAQTKQDDGDLTDALVDALEAVENGDVHPNVSVRDGHTAALLHALENNPEAMHNTVDSLRDYLGGNADGEVDKSVLIRLLLRAGLRAGAPDTRESLADAIAERASNEV
ncbi:hypothetical protein [Haloferax volcanii]|uniref:hypothetical protein n=1 Tax=Haloferax volcanii TaxID=2246 RepID=UPI00385C1851